MSRGKAFITAGKNFDAYSSTIVHQKTVIMANKQNEKGSTSNRGFAAMDEKQQREIARKGGQAVSKNREHMAEIGRKGGEAVSGNREHMSEIGQKGGESRGSQNKPGGKTGNRQ